MQINSTDSRKIQKFIKDNSTLFNRIPPVRFSQNTQKLLSLIFFAFLFSIVLFGDE